MPRVDYSTVTEVAGDRVSREATRMMHDRYQWVAQSATGLDVLEVSCGAGQGLGLTAGLARRVVGMDITSRSLRVARAHYQHRVPLVQSDAQALPFADGSFDVCAIHEAIYYFPDVAQAFAEAHRVLRPGGRLFVSTINPEWADFNPSPFSTRYLAAPALAETLRSTYARVELFGAFPVEVAGIRSQLVSAIKRLAVSFRLIPKTMKGKRFLKRLVYGTLVPVPSEIVADGVPASHVPLEPKGSDAAHFKVIYAVAYRD